MAIFHERGTPVGLWLDNKAGERGFEAGFTFVKLTTFEFEALSCAGLWLDDKAKETGFEPESTFVKLTVTFVKMNF